jgi:hypothetical protein
MAMDLLRHDILMTLQQVSGHTIEVIVDTIFLPLLHGSSAATTRGMYAKTRAAKRLSGPTQHGHVPDRPAPPRL